MIWELYISGYNSLENQPFTCIFKWGSPRKHLIESAAESPKIIPGVPQSTKEIVQSKRGIAIHKTKTQITETENSYPKVAGEELRTSGGTYAAVPTKVHALSSVYVTSFTETGLKQNLTIIIDKTLKLRDTRKDYGRSCYQKLH